MPWGGFVHTESCHEPVCSILLRVRLFTTAAVHFSSSTCPAHRPSRRARTCLLISPTLQSTSQGSAAPAPAAAEWSVQQVSDWFASNVALSDYAHVFEQNKMTGIDLVDLTHDDLSSMGVEACHDRKAILRETAKLSQEKTVSLRLGLWCWCSLRLSIMFIRPKQTRAGRASTTLSTSKCCLSQIQTTMML